MGKRYPLIVALILGITIFAGQLAAAASEKQERIENIEYHARVQLESRVFPLVNDEQIFTELRLNIQTKLTMPMLKPPLVKGIYVSSWTLSSEGKMNELIQLARETEINAFVIDMKDDTGFTSIPSAHPIASQAKSNYTKHKDFKGLMKKMKEENIYLIARVVVFKDYLVTKARPDLALKLTKGEEVWSDDKWISPFSKTNWEYVVQIAKEAAQIGFDEIQFDYVRFPALGNGPTQVAKVSSMTKDDAINGFLSYARKELAQYGVPISADIFGMVSSVNDLGIGQKIETLPKMVDVISPMVYPSHYSLGNFNIPNPDAAPYQTVYASVKDAIDRLPKGSARIRPWLQDFSLRQIYGPHEVREQIKALKDLGIDEWLLWNPRSRYTKAALLSKLKSHQFTDLSLFVTTEQN